MSATDFPILKATFRGTLGFEGECPKVETGTDQILTLESDGESVRLSSSNGDSVIDLLSDGSARSSNAFIDTACMSGLASTIAALGDRVGPQRPKLAQNIRSLAASITPAIPAPGSATLPSAPSELVALDAGRFAAFVGTTVNFLSATGAVEKSLALPEGTTAHAISPDGDTIYVGNPEGRIERIRVATGARYFLAAAGGAIESIAVLGDKLYINDASGAWSTQSVIDRASGRVLASADWRDGVTNPVYAENSQKVFYLDTGVSPNDVHAVDLSQLGEGLTTDIDSPYHGDYGFPAPLRLSPDESFVVTGDGNMFSSVDLKRKGGLGMSFVDLAMEGDSYYVLRADEAGSVLRVLDASFNIVKETKLAGAPQRVFRVDGQTVVTTWDASKNKIIVTRQ